MRIPVYYNYCNLILMYFNGGLHEWQKCTAEAGITSYFHECHKYIW
jgi:hypothetical protein